MANTGRVVNVNARRLDARFVAGNALLFAACRLDRACEVHWSADLDWDYAIAAAITQGLGPLLFRWLEEGQRAGTPDAARDRLSHLYWTAHFRNRVLHQHLQDLLQEGAAAGIAVMPLKGALMAWSYYPEPALRPMSDLDLLVREADLSAFGEVLARLGYERFETHPSPIAVARLDLASQEFRWRARRDGVIVEYRAEPLEPLPLRFADLDPRLSAELRRATDQIWRRAAARADGSGAFQMTTEDAVLHAAAHLSAKHGDLRLIWLHDIAVVLRHAGDFDWSYFWDNATRCQLRDRVAAALESAARWAGAVVPPLDMTSRGGARRLRQRSAGLGTADLRKTPRYVQPVGAVWRGLSGCRPRLEAMRWLLLPCKDFLRYSTAETERPGRGYVRLWLRRHRALAARILGTSSQAARDNQAVS